MHILNKSFGRALAMTAIMALAAFGFLFSITPANAHTSPGGCDSTGVSLSLTVLRADGTTPVGAGTVTPGETIKYRATLSHAGGTNCNYEGGDLDIIAPDGTNNDVDGGVIPLVSTSTPFVGSLATYVVSSADVSGGFLNASAVYSGGTSHLGGNVTPVGANTPAATTFEKLPSEVHTEVHDPAHIDITNGSVFEGTTVHDKATIVVSGPAPTGDVTIVLYGNGTCDLNPPIDGAIYTSSGGMAESVDYPALAAGSYSFLARYGGDANYEPVVGVCEPFTIDPVQPLVIEKTAETSYDREWHWTIDKRADQTDLDITDGQLFDVNYDVLVSATSTDTNHTVSGTITITNPQGNPAMNITSVTDLLDITGLVTPVVCAPSIPVVLGPGESINCTYSKNVAGPVDTQNTVEVGVDGISGGTANAPVVWGAPDNEIDECITVNDTNAEGPQGQVVCAGDGSDSELFQYTITFGTDAPADVILECGENDWPNEARFVTNDTQTPGADNWNVHITVTDCFQGCTLTQGYWKTHNDSFKGGAPTDDNWDNITTLAELSGFFTTVNSYPVVGPNVPPFTWFSVFWTSPSGNAYYNLAHQYMAAKLNVLNGAAAPAGVASAITSAEDFFDSYTPASFSALGKKHALRTQVVGWAGTLGSFNEGTIGPGHCDEQNP
ncbi:MAG TPA: hypothetical protein VJH63_02595 [Candidatus Paceibacterota bacterium]